MPKKLLLSFCIILFSSTTVFAGSAADVLQNRLEQFHSMTTDFSQTVVSSDGMVLQRSSGDMAIQRPGKFRWNTMKPLQQLIVTNGQKVWIYEPDLQQVTIRNLDENISQTPVLLLTSSHAYLQKEFNISQISSKQSGEWFQLLPKDKHESFNKIVIGFTDHHIAEMVLYNNLGENTVVSFSNVNVNPSIDDNDFNFNIPKDIDVIDQTITTSS